MEEPITYFLKKSGFDRSLIKDFAIGDKFAGVMLVDGRIGICSTLGIKIGREIHEKNYTPDPGKEDDRIILNAYFNALHNYSTEYEGHADIFDVVDFAKYRDIVMIGYFESLYEKFRKVNRSLHVFDRAIENDVLEPMNKMSETLGRTEAVIVTGTTIFNRSLLDIIKATSDSTSVFLLGPSNILHPDMFKYRNIKMVFGSVFNNFDSGIFNQVKNGASAREFLTRPLP